MQIRVAVQFQVNNDAQSIQDSFYRLSNPRQQIEAYVYDVVRSSVPKIDLDDVFTTKEEIAQNIKSELTAAMASFGFTIIASPITDIDPDAQVKLAMNGINKAKRLRIAAQDRQMQERPSRTSTFHSSSCPSHAHPMRVLTHPPTHWPTHPLMPPCLIVGRGPSG